MRTYLFLLFTMILSAAQATTIAPVNLEKTVKSSESAFEGTVKSVAVVQTPQGWGEEIVMTVSDPIFGKVKKDGEVRWIQYRVSEELRLAGMPLFQEGQKRIVFLSGPGRGTEYRAPYALGYGNFYPAGEGKAANEFLNRGLFDGVDRKALAEKIAQADPKIQKLSAEEQKIATQSLETALDFAGGAPVSKSLLKRAAKALKAN